MINFIIKNKIFISIFIGLFYILLILYNRLIRKRLPRDIFIDYNYYILFAYFLLFFSSLYIIIYSFREILQIHAKYRILNKLIENPFFEKIFRIGADIVINYILKGPKNLYEYLYKKIKIRPIIDFICKKIWQMCIGDTQYYYISILYIKYSIKLTIVIIFIFEVFYTHNLKIFYKSLIFLLIPLLIELFLFMVNNLAAKNMKIIEEWMDFPINEQRNGFDMRLKIENKDNPLMKISGVNEEERENRILQSMYYHHESWNYYRYTCIIIDHFYNLENKYKPYLNIFIYSLYSIGWGYILFGIFFS